MPLSEENKVIELKYAAKRFGRMSEDERRLSAYQILLKIHAITGWTIPLSELMDILVGQFEKKLSESYENVNEEEIEYAFRNKGLEIKDWGKAMNLSLIDEVMIPYLEKRSELSKFEEQLATPLQIDEKKELTVEEWEEWLLDIKTYPLNIIPIACYDYLVREGKINPSISEKNEYIQKAIPVYSAQIQEDTKFFNEFIAQKYVGVFLGQHKDSLIALSKKMIVFDYLHSKIKE